MSAPVVAIAYNQVAPDALPDEKDILDQVALVEETLSGIGYRTYPVPVTLNLQSFVRQLQELHPSLVVNLVESIENQGEFLIFASAILDFLKLPYTGSPTQALYLTTNKPLAKKWMVLHGISTPAWYPVSTNVVLPSGKRFLAKPAHQDGSLGFDEDLVFVGEDYSNILFGGKIDSSNYFIEEYLSGREFNVSILKGNIGTEVLPIAEMVYNFPEGKPRILGYKAKWEKGSFEYENTIRRFINSAEEPDLCRKIEELSLQCWNIFGLQGYARIDIRLDDHGLPLVLEINTNPCITPGSGFYTACEKAGYSFEEVLQRIMSDMVKP